MVSFLFVFRFVVVTHTFFFSQNQQIARFGLALPQPKDIPEGTEPSLLVLKGPELGYDLAKITGKTAASIMRQAANKLWTKEEQMRHMLSPKMKTKSGMVARTDFSPTRKSQMKGNFLLSFLFKCKSTRPTRLHAIHAKILL